MLVVGSATGHPLASTTRWGKSMPSTSSNQKNTFTLPTPRNTKTNQYTKPEAADLLFLAPLVSRARGDMMTQMLALGYTLTSKKTLWRLCTRETQTRKLLILHG